MKEACFDQDATGVSPSPNLACYSPSNPEKNDLHFARAQQGKRQPSLFASTGKSGDFSKTSEKEESKIKETPPSSKQPPVATVKIGMKPKSESEGFFQKPNESYQFQNCRSACKYRKAHQKAATKSPSHSTDAAAASAALKEAMEQAEARLRSAKEMRESKGNLFKISAKLGPNDVIYKEKRENKAQCEGKSFSKKLIHAAAVKKPEFREAPTLTNEGINPFQSSYNSLETSGRREVVEEISQLVNDASDAEEAFKCPAKEGNVKEVKAKSKNRAEEEEETESNDRRSQEMIGFKEKSELKSLSKNSQVITGCNGETEKSEKSGRITNAVMNTSRKGEIDKIIDEVKEVCIPEKDKISLEPSPQVVDLGQNKSREEDYVNFSIIQEKTESKSGASKLAFKLHSSVPSAAVESVKMKEVKKSGVKNKNNEEDNAAQELFMGETNEKSKVAEKTIHHEENENIRKPANLSYYTENTPDEIKETDQKLEPEEPKKFERTQFAHDKGIIGGTEIPQLQSFTKKSQGIGELASKYQRDGNTYSYNETCEWYSDAKKYTNTSMDSRSEEEMKGLFDTFPKVSMQVKDKISKELSPEVDVHGQDKNNIEDLTKVKTELKPNSRMNSNETCKDSEETCEPDDFYARKEEKKSLASKKDNKCARRVEELNAIPGLPVLDVNMKMKVLINSKVEDTNNEENRVSEESFLYEAEKKTVAARGTSHCAEKEKIKAPSNLLYSAEKDRCKVKEIDQKGELKEPKKVESTQYAHSQDKSEKEKRPEAAQETIEDVGNRNKLGSVKEDSQIDYTEKWAAVTQFLRQCSEKNHKTIFEKEKTMDRMRKDEENGRKDVQKEDTSGKGGVGVEENNVYKEKLLQRKLEEKEREIERQKDNLAVDRVIYGAHGRAVAKDRDRATKVAADKVIAESCQRTPAEAREKAAKASSEKASEGAKVRAAVARATAEALERAARKAALEARQCTERSMNSSRNHRAKDNEAQGRFQANYTDIKQRSTKPDDSSKDALSRIVNQRHSRSTNHGSDGASALRFKARIERHQRIAERAAKALADKNTRDMLVQREQEERNRLADSLDCEVRRWATGKEGNLRALLSTLQYILGPDSGWQPISLTDLVTAAALKKAYRKATLCVHPDKLQQRGASIPQKYKCEKVFDLLKDAWNRFNSEQW